MSGLHSGQPATNALAGRPVRIWLWAVYAMILAMVTIGGITRLTGSGLSMVNWRPLMGTLPPLSESAWDATFDHYKESPEYQQVNSWMTLGDFQEIFFWEYLHRLLGRLIGAVFAVPWLFFLIRKRITGRVAWRTVIAFVGGGAQGLLGWYMVRSGLVDRPEVSHFRLAAHLMLALIVAQYCLWLAVDFDHRSEAAPSRTMARLSWALVVSIGIQIVWGAFMAGKDAGLLYSTFPTMNGQWVPTGMGALDPGWWDAVDNPITIHFIHRTLGWVMVALAIAFFGIGRRHAQTAAQVRALRLVLGVTLLQFGLGAATVWLYVATWIGATHQTVGAILLSCVVYAAFAFGAKPRTPALSAPGQSA